MAFKGFDIGAGLSQFSRDYADIMRRGYQDSLELKRLEADAESRRLANAIQVQNAALSGFGVDPRTAPIFEQFGGGYVTPPMMMSPEFEKEAPVGAAQPVDVSFNETIVDRAPAAAPVPAPSRDQSTRTIEKSSSPKQGTPGIEDFNRAYQTALGVMRQQFPHTFRADGYVHPYVAKQAQEMAMKQLGYMISSARMAPRDDFTKITDDKPAQQPKAPRASTPRLDPIIAAQIKGLSSERNQLTQSLLKPDILSEAMGGMSVDQKRARIREIDDTIAAFSGKQQASAPKQQEPQRVRIKNKKTGAIGFTSKEKADKAVSTGDYELVR